MASTAPARLELLDVSGRRWAGIDAGTAGPGMHHAQLAAGRRVPAGLYRMRLTQAGASRTARVVVVE